MGVILHLSECYHCNQLYWFPLATNGCPQCGSEYVVLYDDNPEIMDEILSDPKFLDKLREKGFIQKDSPK